MPDTLARMDHRHYRVVADCQTLGGDPGCRLLTCCRAEHDRWRTEHNAECHPGAPSRNLSPEEVDAHRVR